jgi:hypothetical protein
VERVDGIESVNREVGELVVDARWPTAGAKKADTYTGDGYVTVRHEHTHNVMNALEFIGKRVRISYSHSAAAQSELQWQERFRNYDTLNQPVWEVGGSK